MSRERFVIAPLSHHLSPPNPVLILSHLSPRRYHREIDAHRKHAQIPQRGTGRHRQRIDDRPTDRKRGGRRQRGRDEAIAHELERGGNVAAALEKPLHEEIARCRELLEGGEVAEDLKGQQQRRLPAKERHTLDDARTFALRIDRRQQRRPVIEWQRVREQADAGRPRRL